MKFSKVTLRKKKLTKGRISLYLDFYPPIIHPESGEETRREFLHLHYKEKPRTADETEAKTNALAVGEKIRHEREIQIRSGQAGMNAIKGRGSFFTFFQGEIEKQSGSTQKGYIQAMRHLYDFVGGKDISFNAVTLDLLEGYRRYLETRANRRTAGRNGPLTVNTIGTYYNKVLTVCRNAYTRGYMPEDLSRKVKRVQQKVEPREVLTLEELERLAKTPCNPEFLKQAAMFSALTGVRFSDIKNLKWGDITETESGPSIRLRIQKTKTTVTQPISKEALSYLGERGDPESKVFQYLEYSYWLNTKLMQWVFDAGITKKIRFHNFRHTFATLLLTAGVDIYTVSKMLGHKDLATTEIYAKLVDEKKREAAEAIKLNIKT